MKTLFLINRILLILLGIGTGAVKIAHMPAEMQLYANGGFGATFTVGFGMLQLLAALLCLSNKTLRPGAAVLGLSFAFATCLVFINQMWVFGFASLLFIAMALFAYAKAGALARDGGATQALLSVAARQ